MELDNSGTNILWQKNLGGTAGDRCESIEETSDGGFILCGQTGSNNTDVSGLHCPNFPCPFGGIEDIWVVKIDSIGNLQSQRCLGGTDTEYGWQVHQTYDGGFIVVGTTFSNDSDVSGNHWPIVGASDIWLVKLDTSLNIQWQKCFGGSGLEEGNSVQQTSDSGFIICGDTYYSNDGDVSGNHGLTDAWVLKVDMMGQLQWQKCYGGTNEDGGFKIIESSDNGYIFIGVTNSNDNDVSGNHGGNDYWVVKIDSIGGIQWQKCYGGSGDDSPSSIQRTSDNGYLFCGGNLSNDGDVAGNNGDEDFWVVKIDSIGNLIWQKSLGGTLWEDAKECREISDSSVIVAGYSVSLDGDITGHHGGLTCNGSSYPCKDYWVVKLSTVGLLVDESILLKDFTCYSDQSQNIHITYNSNNNEQLSLEIIDFTGRTILESQLQSEPGYNNHKIPALNSSSGIYFVRLQNEKSSVVKKLLIRN